MSGKDHVGEVMRLARNLWGHNLDCASGLMKMSMATLSRAESGKTTPSPRLMAAYEKYYSLPPNSLEAVGKNTAVASAIRMGLVKEMRRLMRAASGQ